MTDGEEAAATARWSDAEVDRTIGGRQLDDHQQAVVEAALARLTDGSHAETVTLDWFSETGAATSEAHAPTVTAGV